MPDPLCSRFIRKAHPVITLTKKVSEADRILKEFTESTANIARLKLFLEQSTNKYAQYLAATALKNLLGDNWGKIPVQDKAGIKDYLLNFLAQKALSCEREVMRMMIILLAKICKLSWFDHPELQTMVNEITTLYNVTNHLT